jgi:hypothetical protein
MFLKLQSSETLQCVLQSCWPLGYLNKVRIGHSQSQNSTTIDFFQVAINLKWEIGTLQILSSNT